MDEPGSAYDHKTLNALNEQIAAEQTRIDELERRIRVIDVEVAAWKPPPPPPTIREPNTVPAWFAFLGGIGVTALLGKLIGAVIGR
jgi:uncharacterized coiled-coil protein SlyX